MRFRYIFVFIFKLAFIFVKPLDFSNQVVFVRFNMGLIDARELALRASAA